MTLAWLFDLIAYRLENPRADSYTSQLLAEGEDEILKKIGEEAVEIIVAAKGQGRQRLIEEISDLTYHALVLMAAKEISLADVENELVRRHKSKNSSRDSN